MSLVEFILYRMAGCNKPVAFQELVKEYEQFLRGKSGTLAHSK